MTSPPTPLLSHLQRVRVVVVHEEHDAANAPLLHELQREVALIDTAEHSLAGRLQGAAPEDKESGDKE